jgi:hypothetical protein
MKEKIFADGFSFKRNENAPDFVVGRMSIKVEDAVTWLKSNATASWILGNQQIKLISLRVRQYQRICRSKQIVKGKGDLFPLSLCLECVDFYIPI